MTTQWERVNDAAWVGDDVRVVVARTSPPDPDGPRVLEGAAAWVWVALEQLHTEAELRDIAGDIAPETRDAAGAAIRSAVELLHQAGLTTAIDD